MRSVTIPIMVSLLFLFGMASAGAVEPRRIAKSENKSVVGVVEGINGVSYLQRGGRGGRSDLFLGIRLLESDRVITKLSRAHVRYKDGAFVELGADSAFEVERLRFKPANPMPGNKLADQYDESVFRLLHGMLRVTAADVHRLTRFTIKTSNAILRVTGPSDFYVIQLENERDLTVRVVNGKVEVINAVTNEAMEVPPGTGAHVKVSGVVSKAGKFTPEQLEFLKSRTRI